ncbi:MAG: hypothetical protein ABJP82_11710, partial [Hyphomicrobiales bacterium]
EKGSNETHSINGDCNTAIKPLKINQHDEPDSPLNHKAICSKYPDDGQLGCRNSLRSACLSAMPDKATKVGIGISVANQPISGACGPVPS